MASVIVSNTGSLVLNGGSSTVPKGGYTVSTSNDKVYVKSGSVTWTLDFNDTTLDGSSFGSAKALAAALSDFSRGGSGPGPEPGDAVWGGITGTLSDQLDLQIALNSKADSSSLGTAAAADVGDFATSAQGALADTAVQPAALSSGLAGKLDIGTGTQSGTTYRRGDGTWATPPNTTYAVLSQANAQNPASTVTGLASGDVLAQAIEGRIVAVSANKTLALTDRLTYQRVTAASTVTIPTNDSVAFPIGTKIDFFQAGSGVITFVGAGGVTINSYEDILVTDGKGSAATLKKVGTNEWDLTI